MHTFDESRLPKKNLLSMQIDLSKFEPASEEEKQQHETMRESTTFFRDGIRKLSKNPLAMIKTGNFQEVQKYMSLTGHTFSLYVLPLSNAAAAKLTPEQLAELKAKAEAAKAAKAAAEAAKAAEEPADPACEATNG